MIFINKLYVYIYNITIIIFNAPRYRAKVVSIKSNSEVTVLFIDYGNKEVIRDVFIRLAQIPAGFEALPAQAHEYALAMVQMSGDEDDVEVAIDWAREYLSLDSEPEFSINVEYKVNANIYLKNGGVN